MIMVASVLEGEKRPRKRYTLFIVLDVFLADDRSTLVLWSTTPSLQVLAGREVSEGR